MRQPLFFDSFIICHLHCLCQAANCAELCNFSKFGLTNVSANPLRPPYPLPLLLLPPPCTRHFDSNFRLALPCKAKRGLLGSVCLAIVHSLCVPLLLSRLLSNCTLYQTNLSVCFASSCFYLQGYLIFCIFRDNLAIFFGFVLTTSRTHIAISLHSSL